ncbi:hypothetical protein PMAYCL1PPCAC_00540, partial [Pristionchus mayeri]
RVFSDLLIKDRTRSRVNKRLRDIEAGSEYIMKELRIKEEWKFDYSMGERGSFVIGSRHQLFVDEKSCSIDDIERFCARASIGWLKVEGTLTLPRMPGWARRRTHTLALPRPQDYNYQAYDFIKKFKEIEYLCLRIPHEEHERVRLVDNYLFELAELCKSLNLYRMGSITPNALHKLYKGMVALANNGTKAITQTKNVSIDCEKKDKPIDEIGNEVASFVLDAFDVYATGDFK